MAYLELTYTREPVQWLIDINANLSYRDEIVQFEIPCPIIDQDAYTLYNLSRSGLR